MPAACPSRPRRRTRSPSWRPPPPSTLGVLAADPAACDRVRPAGGRPRRRPHAPPSHGPSSRGRRPRSSDHVKASTSRTTCDARVSQTAIGRPHGRTCTGWTTAPLNLWTTPEAKAKQLGLVDGRREGPRHRPRGRATASRSSSTASPAGSTAATSTRPKRDAASAAPAPPDRAAGLSMAPCPDGSVENGLTSGAVYVYRSVCHAFPQITTYGGWDAHGEHASGKALDIMTSDVDAGRPRSRRSCSRTPPSCTSTTSSGGTASGRRCAPPRAGGTIRRPRSPTANHMDHVHVSTTRRALGAVGAAE